jgi:hypothetical protein
MEQIKNKYIEQYKKYHSNLELYPGNSFANGYLHITDLIQDTNAKTVLDYGCGKGTQYTERKMHEVWNIDMPTLYDPAVPQFEKLPKQIFDGIYSTDVMEHIPEEVIPSVFNWIFTHATKFVFLGISTRPAIAVLPNGENAHCTVKPIEWWEDMINEYNSNHIYTHLKCYGNSNGYKVLNIVKPKEWRIKNLTEC